MPPKSRPVDQLWHAFESRVLSVNIPGAQYADLRQAFYSGTCLLFDLITRSLGADNPTPAEVELMKSIQENLNTYRHELEKPIQENLNTYRHELEKELALEDKP